jgi:hypothetical protein
MSWELRNDDPGRDHFGRANPDRPLRRRSRCGAADDLAALAIAVAVPATSSASRSGHAGSANAGALFSLALVDLPQAEVGTELTLLWGEPDSRRSTVEEHEVREIRVKVANAPYFEKVIKTGKQ